MAEFNYDNAIALSEGKVFVTIDGKNIPLLETKEASAELEFEIEELFALGKRMSGNKITGAKGSGKMTLLYVSSMWNEIAIKYIRTGKLPRMTMTAVTDDANSELGKQVVTITGFKPKKIVPFSMKADKGVLENELDFVFDGIDMSETLTDIKR
ncbi:hypothetical protein EFL96_06320 [Lactococcus lactis]|uniref:Phage tail protein n=1 Tax=Lactococcus lactis TaxID=1358 RepID=A0A6B3S4Z2_9LACT|nr:phage tail tube protein [Lactococcus lactis]MCT1174169.1 hypothetical protein [Lactococcus lactis]MCT1186486.1 hypothetical protein [Lactococcus lactis]MCT1189568.1 hypothetical protein [Lactococcus lactis]MCT1195256.1 hypothetical protein [Lactococcus lactis]NEX49345.1 hypothetical protein [Lactococcus lactis]